LPAAWEDKTTPTLSHQAPNSDLGDTAI